MNYEIYYFADQGSLRKFRKDPVKYCGLLTDPVSRVRFQPTKASPKLDFMDRPYYFAADSTRALFAATPDSFAVRRGM